MVTTALEMSGSAASRRASEHKILDEAVQTLQANASTWARLPVREKIALLSACMNEVAATAEAWVQDGARGKGLAPDHAEEWLVGPVPTMRALRLLSATLERIAAGHSPLQDSQVRTRPDGRAEVRVFPTDGIDGAFFSGFQITALLQPGVTPAEAKQRAGLFYQKKDPEGGVSLILGAGNVSAIPTLDALSKMIGEGYVCIVKVNPVNEWVGPHLERAFKPLIERNFMRVVYGGGDVGSYLVNHPAVVDIHITGSNHTHDLIVWGPPGPERDRRMAANDPVLKKRITSELGNVSPVCVVPHAYSESELDFMARNIGAMITNNASFNCNAAKMLITSKAWPQRQALLDRVARVLEETPTRAAYYPGAFDRYKKLTEGRSLKKIGEADERRLPWTLILDVDAKKKDDVLFTTEPFCALLSETTLDAQDPAEFLRQATSFMNDTVWGTLNAMIVIPPALQSSPTVGPELDRAITELRYGTVGINHWPALVFALVSPPWGGHPSATLANVQSGIGWAHNTYLLEDIEKVVLRGPLTMFPKPMWFANHKRVGEMGRRLLDVEHHPSWLKVPGLVLQALQG